MAISTPQRTALSGENASLIGRPHDIIVAARVRAGNWCRQPPDTRGRVGLCGSWMRGATLGRLGDLRLAGQNGDELIARADVELGEDLVQVVLDRAWADE
jgi:hypothetical protein